MASSFNAFSSAGLSAGAVRDVVQSLTGINVKDYGATGDARKVTDAVLNGTTTVTSATAAFTSADVGKAVWGVETATGLKRLAQTTITAVNSATSITVAAAAVVGSYTGITLVLGTDDTTALQTAYAAAKAAKCNLIVPAGGYIFSALPFDGNLTTVGQCSGIIGAGLNATIFFPAPSYNFASTTSNAGIFLRYNGNGRNAYCFGFWVDCHSNALSGSGYHVISDTSDGLTLDHVRVTHSSGLSNMVLLSGTRTLLRKSSFESSSYIGIQIAGGSALVEDCYTGNHGYWGLFISNIAGTTNVGFSTRWVNGIIDESAAGASVYVSSSTDVVFIGARCFGPLNDYAAEIASSSHARFVGCEIVAFGLSGNRGGLKVNSGCIATLTSCRMHGTGTLFGLSNAGTVYDGGGNVSNNKTGAGTISIPAL